jgi:hypothetical protein
MTDIKLTAARLDVLKAVERGEVKHHRSWGHDPDEDKWRPATGGSKKVNGAIAFLRQVGFVELGSASGPSMYSPKPWNLTEAGEQHLASPTTQES